MNVTELSRKLRIPTSTLREILPLLGFDVGRKAIKVDDTVAEKIIEKFRSAPEEVSRVRESLVKKTIVAPEAEPVKTTTSISIPSTITVRDFSALLKKPVTVVIQELMKNGILANLNELIDYETAAVIAEDFDFKVTPQVTDAVVQQEDDWKGFSKLKTTNSKTRPPIVVVMGHVDHGKTLLLDAIRKANIAAKEHGGITQHIGAYQAKFKEHVITFIDTPGHEAFTSMRSRGARVADLAIIVIAADDGIMPQSEEVLKIIDNAKLPFLIALNKIDRPEADIEKVKQQLAQKNLLPEDWGGKIICIPVSAKTGQGISDLLEHLVLIADLEKDQITAEAELPAVGTIIESRIDKGEGPVATVIIQNGTLHQGSLVQVGRVVGKIKAMRDFNGDFITSAGPSMPARILGLKDTPEVGDMLSIISGDKSLKKTIKGIEEQHKIYRDKQKWQTVKTKQKEKGEDGQKIIDVILKADVLGSLEAIIQSLEILQTDKVRIRIIKKGLGNINDQDMLTAQSTGALLFGFNVPVEANAEEIAKEKDINYFIFKVIYDLTDHIKAELIKLIEYKKVLVEAGRLKVLAVFRKEKSSAIIGGLVTKGKLENNLVADIIRNGKIISRVKINSLQQAKQPIPAAASGSECGLLISGTADIAPDDILQSYNEETVKV